MKRPPSDFPCHYQAALSAHLAPAARLDPRAVEEIGGKIRANGMPVLEFAKLHEHLLVMELLPACPAGKRGALIRKAGNFFAAVIAAAGAEKGGARSAARLRKAINSLSGRTVELASTNRQLGLEVKQRRKAEKALRKSEAALLKSLAKSDLLKEQLRGLSRQILSAQEEERKKISRELHDVVAQALLGISVRLATLRVEAGMNSRSLDRGISQAQRMIAKSANVIHQFARKLRPAALDDLGLIPALQSFMRNFTARTGVRTHLMVFPGVEKLNATKRTVLYRVAQEALTNVSRHAQGSRVEVTIRKDMKFILMEVGDDGKSFNTGRTLLSGRTKRLGLLGRRERVEMVGGRFEIESSPGKGTKVIARIPVSRTMERKWRDGVEETQNKKT